MNDLNAFVRAQLDNDERVARSAAPGPWVYQDIDSVGGGRVCDPTVAIAEIRWDTDRVDPRIRRTVLEVEADGTGEHIARHDPARVLAEVEAKRRIMTIHNRRADVFPDDTGGTFDNCCDGCGYEGICDDPVTEDINDCPVLRLLALPHADHPDYRQEWKP